MYIISYLRAFLVLSSISLFSQTLQVLQADSKKCIVDHADKIILWQQNIEEIVISQDNTSLIIGLENEEYRFNNPTPALSYSTHFLVTNNNETYKLFFTKFPIMQIHSQQAIVDEPKVPANFQYTDGSTNYEGIVGIEIRGGSSQYFPKKTYDLEFWKYEFDHVKKNYAFGALRYDDDWVLDGMYNEPLLNRSFMSHQLWLDIHVPSNIEQEPDAKSGAGVMYVDLFLNDAYVGIYALSEQVDEELLKLKTGTPTVVQGELYKGAQWGPAVTFDDAPSYDNASGYWAGQEYKFPNYSIDWVKLHEFTDFVVNSSYADFNRLIGSKFDLDNAVDYFIFINFLRATDNTGKNTYLAKYKSNNPYFYAPWDLDGVLGLVWDGSKSNYTTDILSNGLFDRLLEQNPDDFHRKLHDRWNELRQDELHKDSLFKRYQNSYELLKNSAALERETLIWNKPHNASEVTYMRNWTSARLNFLDQYFESIILHTNDALEQNASVVAYPNPAKNTLNVELRTAVSEPFYVTNAQGTLLLDGILTRGMNSINTESLADGFYILIVGNTSRKIMIER